MEDTTTQQNTATEQDTGFDDEVRSPEEQPTKEDEEFIDNATDDSHTPPPAVPTRVEYNNVRFGNAVDRLEKLYTALQPDSDSDSDIDCAQPSKRKCVQEQDENPLDNLQHDGPAAPQSPATQTEEEDDEMDTLLVRADNRIYIQV